MLRQRAGVFNLQMQPLPLQGGSAGAGGDIMEGGGGHAAVPNGSRPDSRSLARRKYSGSSSQPM
jgi:hypothetical protein